MGTRPSSGSFRGREGFAERHRGAGRRRNLRIVTDTTVDTFRIADALRPDVQLHFILLFHGRPDAGEPTRPGIPTIPNGNTKAAAIMIGEQAADMIRKD